MFKAKNSVNMVYKCTVQLLEDADVLECEFQPNHKGKFLLEQICDQMDISDRDRDYFGLRFVDNTKQRHWLDLAKNILKQMKGIAVILKPPQRYVDPVVLSFRIKFYPADPLRLSGHGKVLIYQQIKRDLVHGRLYCSAGEAAALGTLIVQEELGDYDPELHTEDYLGNVRFSLRQSDVLERKVMELHQKRTPGSEMKQIYDEFMTIARGLETYGVDPHLVKDHRGTQLYLGINYSGISTFAAGRRAQHFRWPEVHKLNYEGKMFIAHLSYTDASREAKKHTIGFKCPSGAACRYLWRCSIEQMLFFTLPNSQNASVMSGGGFFSWGTKFRYTGRTEREILSEGINALKAERLANGSPSKRKANSVPATPSSPQGDMSEIRYGSLTRSTMSEPMGAGGCLDSTPYMVADNNGIALLETVSEEVRNKSTGRSVDLLSDYFAFRDSFEHSSSDSGFTNLTETRIGMKLGNGVGNSTAEGNNGPNHAFVSASSLSAHRSQPQGQNQTAAVQGDASKSPAGRKHSLIRVFIPSFVTVLLFLFVAAIMIFESDSNSFLAVKNWPEMLCLRYQYYEPLKSYFKARLEKV